LQKAGLIQYRRGHVTILDRETLRQRACECYDISRLEFDRLLGDTAGAPRTDKKHRLISEVGKARENTTRIVPAVSVSRP
jgi:hypothetical protein